MLAYKLILCFTIALAALALPQLSRNTRSTSRIIHGEDASSGQFPWQVALFRSGSFICGAAVIASRWVITAAHCTEGSSATSFSVRVGSHIVNSGGSLINVEAKIEHPNYNSGSGAYPNDVALLRLGSNVDVSEYAVPVASSGTFSGTPCVISGFGRLVSGSLPSTLQWTNMTGMSSSACSSAWSSNYNNNVHLCVTNEDKANGAGACNGDSGGPLVCNGVLAGVTSWGRSGCHVSGTVTHPSVYARLTNYRSWINNECNCL